MLNLFEKIHRSLAKSRLITLICVKVRNQVDAIIGAYLGGSADFRQNGECFVMMHAAPLCAYFVDVGANKGDWAEAFLKSSKASGCLFEPSSNAYQLLLEKFKGAGLTVQNSAVADFDGSSLFIEEPYCGETSSMADTHVPCSIPPRNVQVVTLDAMFADKATCIDYLKIDAEGYDFKVMLGAHRLLGAQRIKFIQFEYNSNWIAVGHSLKQATNYLVNLGYEVYMIRPTGLHKFNYDIWGDYYRYSNFFACTPEGGNQLKAIIGTMI